MSNGIENIIWAKQISKKVNLSIFLIFFFHTHKKILNI